MLSSLGKVKTGAPFMLLHNPR